MTDAPWETLVQPDMEWTIRVRVHEHWLECEAFEIVSREWWDNDAHHKVPVYEAVDPDTAWGKTTDLNKAERVLSGSIKWDGCSNWAWDTEACMWHACTADNVAEMGEIMRRCYALGAERIPTWSGAKA